MEEIHTSSQIKSPYQSHRDGDLVEVVKVCANANTPDASSKLLPTVHDDTILHMAIYMGKESIAIGIIETSSEELITKPNKFGNTALHEAAAAGCVRVVEKLLDKAPDLLSTPNKKGEMPLYTAAHFGQTEMFILLAEKLKNVPDLDFHFCSYDPQHIRSTILHAAIHAEIFELALWIARRPDYLKTVQLKDKNSMTPLQLLSSNSSAFESGMKCGLIKRIIYNCMYHHV
uniref:serine/threonine-protein phosphatase 6 regulatory ankyrin repeat subunit C-like n=1 Tax=Fragaria vesca subsp. vesca TaxID=101020 RepID=UPI0005CA72C7|nr:PREDICTED: serine/threonine-protein phosphatase 6 regulatory ankyrin repeat subunit C-like [Fragaria vesca subsp. vesca]